MVIVLIRTKLHPEADRGVYEALNAQMFELVQTMPGFVGASGYASGEGEDIGIVRFTSLDALRAWREHPEHVVVQERGKAELYASYTIEVCTVVRAYDFARQHVR
jgi:heme-degrading monooxygenase HmoA